VPIRLLLVILLIGRGVAAFPSGQEPRRVARLVGVNRGENRMFAYNALQFAERAVQELVAVLNEQGFVVRALTGPQATNAHINTALADVLKGPNARGVVIIGFAGHGVQMPLDDDPGQPVRDDGGRELSDA
jgi:hypothetical protein